MKQHRIVEIATSSSGKLYVRILRGNKLSQSKNRIYFPTPHVSSLLDLAVYNRHGKNLHVSVLSSGVAISLFD